MISYMIQPKRSWKLIHRNMLRKRLAIIGAVAIVIFVADVIVLKFQDGKSFYVQRLEKDYSCTPKTNIMFLKVHKAGSSTVYNVMMRFALNNKLNVVIPNKNPNFGQHNYLGLGNNLTKDMIMPIPKGEQYNIVTNHVVYNRSFFESILPNDTFYFAIVRDPEDRFISAAKYYGLLRTLSKQDKYFNHTQFVFERFLENPKRFGYSDHVHNHMAHDFGIPKQFYENETFIKSYIQKLDQEFDVVLLMEYFDESLILLRRFLCWTIKDVLFVKQNSGGKPQKKIVFTENDSRRLRKFQHADVMIYEHFSKKFWRVFNSFGIDLHDEIGHFKEVRRRMQSFCSTYKYLKVKYLEIENSTWNSAFKITLYDCDMLLKTELSMLKIAREVAKAKMNKTRTFLSS